MILKKNISFGLEQRRINGILQVESIRIRMRVTYSGNRIEIPLPFRVNYDKWDSESECVLSGIKVKPGTKEINSTIESYRQWMEQAFAKYELVEKRIPSKDELKQTFNELAGKKTENKTENTNVFVAYDEFVQEGSSRWTVGTLKKLKTIFSHLKEFDNNLLFGEINESRLIKYVDFLINKKNLRNSTIEKEIRIIKWFFNWSSKKQLITHLNYKDFKPKLKTINKKIIFLTWDELIRLYAFQIPQSKNYLERVRDVFCFCCFTSLRYSDAYNLKRSNITETTIELVTVKTHDNISIDFNQYSKSIYEKYKDFPFANNKALPVISNQKMNDYLKELGELACIDTPETITFYKGNIRIEEVIPKYELLTTHCGRRTFICNALALGIPPHVVMKWTGHSDYMAMKPYIGVADETKSESMKKFNK